MGTPPLAEQLLVGLVMRPELVRAVVPADALQRLPQAVALVDGGAGMALGTVDRAVTEQLHVVITGWGSPRFDDELLARFPRLGLIAHTGGTVRPVVSPAVWRRDIRVTSAAAANAIPVAEFTVAAIVLAGKDAFRARDTYRTARAASTLGAPPLLDINVGNSRRRIGIVGASHVGRAVIGLLERFDCTIGLYDPYVTSADAEGLGATLLPLDDLCAWADVVSLHAPARPATRGMIGPAQLAAMRDGTWLVNTARGMLVDTAALLAHCRTGRISALLDTVEPADRQAYAELFELPNVVLTPHVAGARGNELRRLGELAVDEVCRYATGQPLHHEVREADLLRLA